MTEKSRRIIKKVAELYSFGNERKTVEEVTQINYEKLLDKEADWDKAFEEYEVDDVLQAVDNFWRFKSDKNRPSVAQILSFLNTEKEVKKIPHKEEEQRVKYYNIETMYFNRDKELGILKYNMNIYKRAVDRIMHDMMDEWCRENNFKFNDKDDAVAYHKKFQKATELGYFNEFDAILENIAQESGYY